MVSNRKARLLFVKPLTPYRISNRKWVNIFNRSGDTALYKQRRSARQQRAINRARSIGYDF